MTPTAIGIVATSVGAQRRTAGWRRSGWRRARWRRRSTTPIGDEDHRLAHHQPQHVAAAARRAPCGCRSRWCGARRCTTSARTGRSTASSSASAAEQRVGLREQLLLLRSAARPARSASTRPSAAGSGSICRTASRIGAHDAAGSPAVRTSNDGGADARLQVRHVHRRRRLVADAVVLGVAQHADDLELAAVLDARCRSAGRSGSRSGNTSCAAASLMIATFGAVSLSRVGEARGRHERNPITSKKFGETTRRLIVLSRCVRRVGAALDEDARLS